MVSEELIRVAILWHEMWQEGLEDASRLYFGDKNIEGMFATLEPLHKILEKVSLSLPPPLPPWSLPPPTSSFNTIKGT